jgi:hypothetical protein
MPGTWLRLWLALTMLAAAAQAAPPLTQIQDLLYKANGTLFDGVAQIEWKAFTASDGSLVGQNSVTVRIIRGQVRVGLIPTTSGNPSLPYTVRLNSEGKTQWIEYWSVPPSSAILRLRDVRTQALATAGNLTNPYVDIQEVTGLRTELDLRPARGAGWVPGRAAVIGSSGALNAVAGNDGDCVRVDGTSGPCGFSTVFVDAETPSGGIDGANDTFTLGAIPSPVSSLRLFRNGLLLIQGSEYTIAANVVRLASARIPVAGDVLQAWYRISGAQASLVDLETPTGAVNGVNAVFTLANAPVPAASIQVYRNGVLQKLGVDFTIAARTLTFLPLSIPMAGDIVQASYRR